MRRDGILWAGAVAVVVVIAVAATVLRSPSPTERAADPPSSAASPEPPTHAAEPSEATPTPARPVRLGLHVTTVELAAWRTRARSGPYRTAGDAGERSPADWDRIQRNRDRFVADPGEGRWSGPGGDGCVAGGGAGAAAPGETQLSLLRDAAFASLITGDADTRTLAAQELLAQSQVAGVDFADRSRWCLETIGDRNPGFEIANWLTSLLYALEYIEIADRVEGTTSLDEEETRAILAWMHAAAAWMVHDVDVALARNFRDRDAGDEAPYRLSDERRTHPVVDAAAYDGSGEVIGAIARYYNNRRAQQQRFAGLLGLHLLHREDALHLSLSDGGPTAEELVRSAERFAADYLVYSTYPDGFTGEFHRATERLPDLGWGYAIAAVAPLLTFADAAARAGDPTLLELVTAAGVHGSEGAPDGEQGKSYRWLVTQLLGHLDGTHDRYLPGHADDPDFRIDGVHAPADWESAHDLALLPAVRYWDDPAHVRIITRTAPGTSPWSDEPEGFGSYVPWTGDWGTLPGVLFMFADDPGGVTPYPERPTATVPRGEDAPAAPTSEETENT